MLPNNFEFEEQIHLHMIDHVFLPRHLPTELNDNNHNDRLIKVEENL